MLQRFEEQTADLLCRLWWSLLQFTFLLPREGLGFSLHFDTVFPTELPILSQKLNGSLLGLVKYEIFKTYFSVSLYE